MKSEEINRPSPANPRGKRARALTRAIDMVSEEFIENFAQTGFDEEPEKRPDKALANLGCDGQSCLESAAEQTLTARKLREEREAQDLAKAKTEFSGFASLLDKAKKTSKESVFSRLLNDQEDECEFENDKGNENIPGTSEQTGRAAGDAFKPGTETTLDGSIIRVKELGQKKRGLYTSCMQKPSIPDAASIAKTTAEVGIRKPSAAQIEAAVLQAAHTNEARAIARAQANLAMEAQAKLALDEQQGTSCPIMKYGLAPITALWRKLTTWIKPKAS